MHEVSATIRARRDVTRTTRVLATCIIPRRRAPQEECADARQHLAAIDSESPTHKLERNERKPKILNFRERKHPFNMPIAPIGPQQERANASEGANKSRNETEIQSKPAAPMRPAAKTMKRSEARTERPDKAYRESKRNPPSSAEDERDWSGKSTAQRNRKRARQSN
ncbi:hypothetical protein B0H12DRAFT_1081497 [Mycena haematopus]|nr:hypothetical protein B0H12DRAFT_1081497 [Mycena haematopus]